MRASIAICLAAVSAATGFSARADELLLRDGNVSTALLVLNNGNVISGKLTPRTGGYDVALPAGRMFVTSQQIRFRATDMEDAYLRMRASIQNLTPTSHIELARWCVNNKLPSQARRELLDALFKDQDNTDARLMLEGLTREERRAQDAAASRITAEQREAMSDAIAFRDNLPERRSLGGLPRSLATTFTRHVQPILSNKCGNARCHGPGRNEFTIISLKRGVSTVTSERNLAAVLGAINFDNPASSPVLQAATGSHGDNRAVLFPGQAGSRPLTILREWVMAVGKELGPMESSATHTQSTQADNSAAIVQTAFVTTPDESHSADSNYAPALSVHGTRREIGTSDRNMLKNAAIATRQDKFDPDVFNNRFHGGSQSSRRPME